MQETLSKQDIIDLAHNCGFEDVGFTSADPFESHLKFLEKSREKYEWAEQKGLSLLKGTYPETILKGAQTIIVLMEVYFRSSYPKEMESYFGRCYLDDDRVTKDGLAIRIRRFRSKLSDHGINTKCPFNLPHRVAAARAGMGTFGKNCLFYSSKVALKSSWVLPIAIVIDQMIEPDEPSIKMGCPKWCKNACIAACPTGALNGNGTINPEKCISYLTYFGEGLTPVELREPIGLMVYGCDRCQNVCPRNQSWLAKDFPQNPKVEKKAPYFNLKKLLHMDRSYFEKRIWPHMFYMDYSDIWRWKMNVARVMGNSGDVDYTPDLIRAFEREEDERVLSMVVWALGRIGGKDAQEALFQFQSGSSGIVKEEIILALKGLKQETFKDAI